MSEFPTVFLDRDGTINVDYGYVVSPDDVELLPGTAEAIAQLRNAGYRIAIVSNQSAVARGMASREDVDACNERLLGLLREQNGDAVVESVLYSIDHPDTATDRRKPGVGMLRDLPWSYRPASSWMIGDKQSDVDFGKNAGLPERHCLLLGTGVGSVSSLLEAAGLILREGQNESEKLDGKTRCK